jgi:hypothetical protein
MGFLFFYYPYLYLAQGAFMIWMLTDAYRRRAEQFWYWVIIFVPGLGAWAYFFAVKSGDFRRFHLNQNFFLFPSRPSLSELRYRSEQVPTLANHLALGERLIEKEEFEQAVPPLQAALKREPEHSRVLYCLALCHTRQGQPDLALPLLEKLLQGEPRWSNYIAWHLLIEARCDAGDSEGALANCRELVRLSPTLQHRCLLAEYLLHKGLHEEARSLLEQSLQDHYFTPRPIRWRNRRWASRARRLQKQVATR